MPNWCQNELCITGPKALIEELEATKLELQKLFPCPQELKDTVSPAQYNAPEKYKTNIEKYGSGDWYDWQVKNWGTKWDIGPVDNMWSELHDTEDSFLQASFDSAWGPPVEAFKKLFFKYKDRGIKIQLDYFEGGCAFVGRLEANLQDDVIDVYYDFESSSDLEDALDEMPDHFAENEVAYLKEQEAEIAKENKKIKKTKEIKTSKKSNKKSGNKSIKKVTKKKTIKKPIKKSASTKKVSKVKKSASTKRSNKK